MTIAQLKQKLAHPVALVAQGFMAGAILFYATAPGEATAQTTPAPIEAAR